jgi:hypothetical protein
MTKRKRAGVEAPEAKIKRLVGDEQTVQDVRNHRLRQVLPIE